MDYSDDGFDDDLLDAPARRAAIFEGLTGTTNHSLDRTAPTDVQSMLMARFAHTYRGEQRVNTRDAAKFLGVSQRTVQRYMKQGRMPAGDAHRRLALHVRQQTTRKAGRRSTAEAARARAAEHLEKKGGVRLTVHGWQGPPPSSREDLRRSRNAYHDVDASQFDAMLDAYVDGGEEGMQSWMQDTLGGEGGYLPDWTISSIDRFSIGESGRDWL